MREYNLICGENQLDDLSLSAKPLPQKNADELIDMLEHLEDVKGISRITTLLAP